jgi:hypothetical protein
LKLLTLAVLSLSRAPKQLKVIKLFAKALQGLLIYVANSGEKFASLFTFSDAICTQNFANTKMIKEKLSLYNRQKSLSF